MKSHRFLNVPLIAPMLVLTLALGLTLTGCGKPATPPGGTGTADGGTGGDAATTGGDTGDTTSTDGTTEPASTTESLNKSEKIELGNIPNLSVYSNTHFLAGQPTAEDIPLLKEKDIQLIINLRTEDEDLGFEEKKVIEEAGIKYTNIPFTSGTLTDEKIEKIRGLLRDTNNQPMMMHCGSANRVGAVWLIYRVLDEGWKYEDALEDAKSVGLKSAELTERAKKYIEANDTSK